MTEQKDPNGIGAHDGGSKLDFGKNRVSLLFMQYFPNAIDAITSVSEFGAKKYSPGGWKDVPDGYQRYTDAMSRHYLADCKGEVFDTETDLPHDFQLAWNALARIEIALKDGKYNRKTSRAEFVEAFLQPYVGKKIPKLETTIQPPRQNEFDPDAASYVDKNGVIWKPLSKLKPHNAQDQNSRERDALKVPTENPDLEKAVAQSVSGLAEDLKAKSIKQSCPQCGSENGYRSVVGNWMCYPCQEPKTSNIVPATPSVSAYEENVKADRSNKAPVDEQRDQLNADYDEAQIKKLP